jgi:archaellum component FlaF (FlaF/FlaG flagellin family)
MSTNQNEGIRIQSIQLIISVLIVLGAIFTTWMSVNSRIAILETKQADDDAFRIEVRNYFKELSAGQTKILIEMEGKKDKDD